MTDRNKIAIRWTGMTNRPTRQSFEAITLNIFGADAVADRSGALYLAGDRTLVVSDLHLEKGSAFAARGIMLPPYDTRETLDRLANVIKRYRPIRVIALGDSLHDVRAGDRLGSHERACIRAFQTGREWIWVMGNHDPEIPSDIGGDTSASIELANITLRHQPTAQISEREVAGHLHPAARVTLSGASLRRPCFVVSPARILLPAFGAFTGGLNVLDKAFAPYFPGADFEIHVLGRNGIYPVARTNLCHD